MTRYIVDLSDNAGRTLNDLSDAAHVTPSEVLRDALSVYWWLAREYGQGNRFMVQRGSKVDELVFPSLKDMGPLPELQKRTGDPASREAELSEPRQAEDGNGPSEGGSGK